MVGERGSALLCKARQIGGGGFLRSGESKKGFTFLLLLFTGLGRDIGSSAEVATG